MIQPRPGVLALILTALTACGPAVEFPAEGGSTTEAEGSRGTIDPSAPVPPDTSPSAPDPDPPQPTTDPSTGPTDGTTGGSESSSSGDWDTTNGCGFLGCGDLPPSRIECDMLLQDCPEGEKCAPWANDGGSSWNAARSQDSSGCCLPFCDVGAPDCPGEMDCMAWFKKGSEPPGSEHIGLCVDA